MDKFEKKIREEQLRDKINIFRNINMTGEKPKEKPKTDIKKSVFDEFENKE